MAGNGIDFQLYLDLLPDSTLYEHSYMHRDLVSHVTVAASTDFVITGSCDGHVKFWKKMTDDIEFVKHFQAHLGKIHALVASPDGLRVVSTAEDKMIKFFDIQSYDMINMISVPYVPGAVCWLKHTAGDNVVHE
jgi:peptidylprolyl isomerase domain and WD repeat-containing protein 1